MVCDEDPSATSVFWGAAAGISRDPLRVWLKRIDAEILALNVYKLPKHPHRYLGISVGMFG